MMSSKDLCFRVLVVMNKRAKTEVILLLLIITSLFTTTPTTAALKSNACDFPSIFNFGDSNSDTGSETAVFSGRLPSPYGDTFFGEPSSRFSDGRLIIDFLASELDLPHLSSILDSLNSNYSHGANFAIDGSTIKHLSGKAIDVGYNPVSLKTQLLQFDQFKSRSIELYHKGKIDGIPKPEDFSKALYMLDIGQNDLNYQLQFTTSTIQDVLNSIPFLINQTSLAIQELYEHGARSFWIHNTGPIGCLPILLMLYPPNADEVDEIGCIKSFNEIAEVFNLKLYSMVSQLRLQFQDAAFTYVNIYKAKYSLFKQATNFGFINTHSCCCKHHEEPNKHCFLSTAVDGVAVDVNTCSNKSEYIFFDVFHYTEAANRLVASQVLEGNLSDPPGPISSACLNSEGGRSRIKRGIIYSQVQFN